MKKYLSVYVVLLKMNIAAMFAYRANFVNSIASSIGWAIVSISAVFLLTAKTPSVFGWTRGEFFLLIGIYNILNGLFLMFFARNFERFSKIIHYAQLDSILIKPIDSQFIVSLSIFNIAGLARVVIGIIFTWYIVNSLGLNLNVLMFTEFLIFLILSMIIFYSIWFLILVPVIWFSNLTNLVEFLYVVNNLGRYPSELLSSTRNLFLFLLIPFTLMASMPAKELLSRLTVVDLIMFVSVALGLFYISRKFYFFALRSYTSASS